MQGSSNDIIIQGIQQLLDSGCSFALYRRPEYDSVELVIQTDGEPYEVTPDDALLDGFIFAPFHTTKYRPTLLIRADRKACGWHEVLQSIEALPHHRVKLNQLDHHRAEDAEVAQSHFYDDRYRDVLAQIAEQRFEKLVLTYCERSNSRYHLHHREAQVFLRALEAYPNAMVSLVYTPQGGRWIGCTPELLLEREGDHWRTMSLAGTCTREDGDWNTKNVHEQDVVTRYISKSLRQLGAEEHHDHFSTMQIGHLLHIRTNFCFSFDAPTHTLSVIRALHPTPAVCGFPKEASYQYLRYCERACRNYFSGYLGPIHGNEEAHIYVNLRCAQICKDHTYYHAGGGITALSRLDEEREEIHRKLRILKNLI